MTILYLTIYVCLSVNTFYNENLFLEKRNYDKNISNFI